MPDLKVGQTVYVRPLCNAARDSKAIRTEVISKVGNKHFELFGWWKQRFVNETMLHDGRGYSPDWRVYLTMKEIEDEDEYVAIGNFFRNKFGIYERNSFTLEQLRAMYAIANPKEDK